MGITNQAKAAVLTGKTARWVSRLTGRGGTAIPGVAALKVDRKVIAHLSHALKEVIFVTGTNGKTTTANLLTEVLEASGRKVLTNKEGANMITGIAAAFVNGASWTGKLPYDTAVLEVDEASLPKIIEQLTPTSIVVTNFFRDQLDRYGEMDRLISVLEKAISPVETKLILNGDDPFVMRFQALNKETVTYGLHENAYEFEQYDMSESRFCPRCGKALFYRHVHYGQLGVFACPCGFVRGNLSYECTSLTYQNSLSFVVNHQSYDLSIKGIYNVYNALAAMAAASELGVSPEKIKKGFQKQPIKNGRMQEYEFSDQSVLLNLIKNPAGGNASLSELRSLLKHQPVQVGLFLNDLAADGRDISWIWDVDFERLLHPNVTRVVCSGLRAEELALRIKYAGIEEKKIVTVPKLEEAVATILSQKEAAMLLPTYTNLEKVRSHLDEAIKKSEGSRFPSQ
jgi:lipid II isoglutaminyl synthase (glutamine-hydrolysing)